MKDSGRKFAGDIYTQRKRRELEGAVSGEAVGIDCSGLVSHVGSCKRKLFHAGITAAL